MRRRAFVLFLVAVGIAFGNAANGNTAAWGFVGLAIAALVLALVVDK